MVITNRAARYPYIYNLDYIYSVTLLQICSNNFNRYEEQSIAFRPVILLNSFITIQDSFTDELKTHQNGPLKALVRDSTPFQFATFSQPLSQKRQVLK